ncbi:hypothetical protein [Sphingomonas sp.]|uniref:hypothetical protein n=1 Tax=Sphingomonas sp. TaxID=28214 RepID=UPI0038B09036
MASRAASTIFPAAVQTRHHRQNWGDTQPTVEHESPGTDVALTQHKQQNLAAEWNRYHLFRVSYAIEPISALGREQKNIGGPETAPRSLSFALEIHVVPANETLHCF